MGRTPGQGRLVTQTLGSDPGYALRVASVVRDDLGNAAG